MTKKTIASSRTSTCSTSSVLALTSALILGLLLASAPAAAEERASTTERLVSDLFGSAGPSLDAMASEGRGLAWSLRYRTPADAGPRDRLAHVLGSLLEARLADLEGLRRVVAVPAPPEASRADLRAGARGSDADVLLLLEAWESRHHLHLVGELYDVRLTFWSRIRHPVTGMRSHFYSVARLDAELRSLMDAKPARASRFRLERLSTPIGPSGRLLAAACGDVDGDGLNETVGLSARFLYLTRLSDRGPEALAKVPLAGLPQTTRRTRVPFGAAVVVDLDGDGAKEVAVWTSDLAGGQLFDWRDGGLGAGPRPLPGLPLAALPPIGTGGGAEHLLLGAVALGRNHLEPRLMTFSASGEAPWQPAPDLHWNLAGHALNLPAPGEWSDLVAVLDTRGRLRVDGGGQTWRLKRAGVALALTDFEDDGTAELISTAASWPDEPDAVRVHRLDPGGGPRLVWSSPTKSPVIALAAGDADNDGRTEVLVATTGGTHLLRPID